MNAEMPANESARLLKLAEYQLLDTPPEPAFDALAELAAEVARAPIALISLTDRDREWFKARVGLERCEVPRPFAFCAQVVASELPLFVPDATQDARFARNPLVTGPTPVRAYAGFPLRTPDGFVLGAFCVMDAQARAFSEHQKELLRKLAHQCVDQLEWRRQRLQGRTRQHELMAELRQASDVASRLESIVASANLAIIETTPDGVIREFNPAAERMLGYEAREVVGKATPALFHVPEEVSQRSLALSHELGLPLETGFPALVARTRYGAADEYECTHVHKDGTRFPVQLSLTARRGATGQIVGYLGVVSDWSANRSVEARAEHHARLQRLQAEVNELVAGRPLRRPLLQGCAEATVKHLDAALARIWVLDEQDHVLGLEASAGFTTELDGPVARIPVGKFKVGLIAQRRQPELHNNVLEDPRLADPAWARREGLVSFAAHPLLLGDRVLGVLAIFARHPLPPTILNALSLVASTAAVTLGRAAGGAEDAQR